MTNKDKKPPATSNLNPELRERTDTTHDTSPTAAPLSTTEAKEGAQGEGWSILWLVVTVLSVAVALYLLL